MTDHKDSNDRDEHPTPSGSSDKPGSNRPDEHSEESADASADDAWAAFVREHQDDLSSLEHSHDARTFEKKVRAARKKAALNVTELKPDVFADSRERTSGPRDFQTSWLDTDNVLDQGNDFVPPNPAIGPVHRSTLVFVALLVLGVLGLAASVFLPSLAGVLGAVCGAMTIIGAAGLFFQHHGHRETRRDPSDDGARV